MSEELRDALSEAIAEHDEAAPVAETPAPVVEAAPANVDVAPANTDAEKTEAKSGRDGKGRFQKADSNASKLTQGQKPDGQRTQAAPGEAPPIDAGAAPSEKPVAPELKAPQSWKAGVREEWTKLPPAVQQEVVRRERETAQVLQESVAARKFHQDFQQTVGPFEGMIRSEGGEPLRAVANLLQTAAALRTAPAAHKAQLVANMVRTFGVPIEALDAALAGQPAPPSGPQHFDPGQFAQQIEQNLMNKLQAGRQQSARAQAEQEIGKFREGAEFFEDVREDVSDILALAAQRGRAMSLEQAYNQALKLHPEISQVISQREAAKQANAQNASTQRARAASSSVKSQPAPAVGGNGQTDDMRGALMASVSELSGR